MKWADFFHADTNYRIFESTISLEQNDERAWFFYVDTDSWKIEVDWKTLGWWTFSKNGCGHSVFRTLKLAVCQGKMNEINWFLLCWYKFIKAKLKV